MMVLPLLRSIGYGKQFSTCKGIAVVSPASVALRGGGAGVAIVARKYEHQPPPLLQQQQHSVAVLPLLRVQRSQQTATEKN